MAWVTEYDMTWTSPVGNGSIYLQRDEGTYQMPLTLKGDSLQIRNSIPSWDDPVARLNCTFTIVNDLSDFYELMPLLTISEGQIKVVVTNDSIISAGVTLFEGYLNCETVSQTMLNWAPITLTASGYLSKLKNTYPTTVDTLQYESLIDTVIACITLTGSEDPIHVNIGLYENNSAPAANQTVFNRIDTFQEVWWENNHERMDALEILTSILKTFNCYIYWYNNIWYIRHYEDLGDLTPHYVIYDPTISAGYSYADTGTAWDVPYVALDIYNTTFFNQVGDTQKLNVIPGLLQYSINLKLKQYFNLFYADLLNTYESTNPTPALSARREWWAYDVPGTIEWSKHGEPFRDIENSSYRYGDDLGGTGDFTAGLSTRFNVTANWDTMVNISFKFGVSSITNLFATGLREDMNIKFHYYLCTFDSVVANRDYFDNSDDSLDTWTFVANGDRTVNYNEIDITAADLDNDLFTYTASINVPIGSIDGVLDSSGDVGHLDLVFCLGTEICSMTGESDRAASSCYYGDIKATVSEAPVDNLIEGVITTDFIEKKEVTLELFDAGWSYRNSLFRYVNQYYNTLAEDWTYDGVTIDKLEDWLMTSRFRLYRIARQKIVMDTYLNDIAAFELLYPWYDSKQSDKPFTLLGMTLKPQSNTATIELYEYDDAEDITLA